MKLNFKPKKAILLIVFIILIFVIDVTNFSKSVKNFFFSFSSPIQKKFVSGGNSFFDFLSNTFQKENLKKELETERIRNQELFSQIIGLKDLEKENQSLREALNIGLEKDFQLEICSFISKNISGNSLAIDKGSEDGIATGQPVITGQKVLVGRIGSVYNNFSEVVLITNKSSSFDARIFEKEIDGLVKGGGDSELLFDLLPKEEEISDGALVVTSALGGIFPKDLLVGQIKEVHKTDLEPFQTAKIQPSFDLRQLENLFIITNFKK